MIDATILIVTTEEPERNLRDELELRRDVETAEAQLANGEGVPHEVARDVVLSILR